MYHKIIYLLNQFNRKSNIDEIQFEKLKTVLQHAFYNVTFYRNKFKENNVSLEKIKKLEDLEKLPLSSKKEIRKNPLKNIISRRFEINNSLKISTGGSTGEPFKVYLDKSAEEIFNAIVFRTYNSIGVRPWHKRAYFNFELYEKKSLLQEFGLNRLYGVSIIRNESEQYEKLKRINPDVISSFPSTLLNIAKYNKGKRINPKIIILHGEVVTPEAKKIIASNYDSDVYEFYSSVEGCLMAADCYLHKGLHIISDAAILEFLNNKNEYVKHNKMGRIILTNLFNLMMPFIRYDTGDIGSLSSRKCKCGNPAPLINHIEGRLNDFFVLSDGRVVDPRSLDASMRFFIAKYNKKYGWNIEKYQIIQEELNSVVIKIVKGTNLSRNDINKIFTLMKKILGKDVKIDIRIVNSIEKTKRGKMRSVISNIKLLRNF
jgi:phenylacetate-CoA ligase